MSEIKCPNCGQVFQVDESGWQRIVSQVRTSEFEHDLHEREKALRSERDQAVELARAREREGMAGEAAKKDARIAELQARIEAMEGERELSIGAVRAQSEGKLAELASQLREAKDAARIAESDARAALQEQLAERDARIAELKARISGLDDAAQAERRLAVEQAQAQAREQRAEVERERDELRLRIESAAREAESERELAVQRVESAAREERVRIERERDELAAQVERQKIEAAGAEAAHAADLAEKLRLKDELIADRDREIERVRDMRSRLSTKMLGETLEQHCEISFNQIRMSAFPNAFFEKDTEAVKGDDGRPTKGDYIFRELDGEGDEVVSIMFEMKTEQEDGIGHKRNEDHLKKLDADRTKKGCEYAVLVSTLEPESELFNSGIVDVSYRYPKMYVVRPQFFIPIITLLRNAALKSLDYKKQLDLARRQSIDVTSFEAKLEDFKERFGRNYELASRRFQTAIEEIDKTIDHLQKVRESLVGSSRNLELANRRAEDLTIKRLTRGNPTMKAMFAEAAKASDDEGEPSDEAAPAEQEGDGE